MRPLGRNIPWKSISIPWIRRSKGWNFRSKATFQRKNSSETCHIVAKTPFSAVPAAVRCTDVFHYQAFLIFVHLPPGTQGYGKIAFSVLKGRRSSPSACCRGWLCRAYACSTPLGPPSSSPFRCKIAGATPSPPPSRQHVAVVPLSSCLCQCNASRDAAVPVAIPAACRCDTALPMSTSVQRTCRAAVPIPISV